MQENKALHKSSLENDYKSITYGAPDYVDISNPLQVILFYKLFNTIILLDNRLNLINQFTVPLGTTLIANAGEDKIWVYNNMSNLLSIYNYRTSKIEKNSIPITEKIIELKGNLNEAITKTHHNKLDIYNFVARKTSTKDLGQIQLPVSMQGKYSVQNHKLYKNKTPVMSVGGSIITFEVQNNVLYYFKDRNIYKTPITQE